MSITRRSHGKLGVSLLNKSMSNESESWFHTGLMMYWANTMCRNGDLTTWWIRRNIEFWIRVGNRVKGFIELIKIGFEWAIVEYLGSIRAREDGRFMGFSIDDGSVGSAMIP